MIAFHISFLSLIFAFVSGQIENNATSHNINDILPQVYKVNLNNYIIYGNRANSDASGQNRSGLIFIGI